MTSIHYTEDDGNTQFIQQLKNPNADRLDDCCQVAKDVFNEKVSSLLNDIGTGRQKELLPDLIAIEHLSCEDFLRMLESLSSINSSSGNLITATTQAVGRFIRLDRVPTSMFTVFANVVKQAGAEAHQAWLNCQEKSALNTTDSTWQNQLELSEDNKFNTWDNILLAAYKPLDDVQKRGGANAAYILQYVHEILSDGTPREIRSILDRLIDYTTGAPTIMKLKGLLIRASKGTITKPHAALKWNGKFKRIKERNKDYFTVIGEEE